jgi:hypothetical protein
MIGTGVTRTLTVSATLPTSGASPVSTLATMRAVPRARGVIAPAALTVATGRVERPPRGRAVAEQLVVGVDHRGAQEHRDARRQPDDRRAVGDEHLPHRDRPHRDLGRGALAVGRRADGCPARRDPGDEPRGDTIATASSLDENDTCRRWCVITLPPLPSGTPEACTCWPGRWW